GMDVYPGDPEVQIEEVQSLEKDGWQLKRLVLGSHTGTHLDVPYHMTAQGIKLDELPLERCFGDAIMVRVESEFPKHVGLVFRSDELTEELLPKFIQASTPFVVVGDSATLSVELERQLLQRDILTFTDLTNLSELPDDQHFAFYGIPLKIKDGDGSPIRAFAILP
nr:cyclase family protein [Candidatus Doudnabacteria bacterium]